MQLGLQQLIAQREPLVIVVDARLIQQQLVLEARVGDSAAAPRPNRSRRKSPSSDSVVSGLSRFA